MTRCINFHMWRLNQGYSFMIQTDEQKVQFANIFYEEQDQIKEILSRHTKLIMTLSHFDTPPTGDAV